MLHSHSGGRLSLSLLAFLAGGRIAHASTYSYGSYGVTNEQNISIYTPASVTGAAGQIDFKGTGANAGVEFLAWCLDIFTDLKTSGPFSVGTLTTAGPGGHNPSLTTTQIGEIGALIVNGDALIHTSYDVSAATQLAIWKVEYGASFSSDGISSSVTKLAQQFLSEVGPGGTLAPVYNVTLLSGPGNQSQGIAATPVPSTWTMMLLGLAGVGFVGYRGAKRRSVARTA